MFNRQNAALINQVLRISKTEKIKQQTQSLNQDKKIKKAKDLFTYKWEKWEKDNLKNAIAAQTALELRKMINLHGIHGQISPVKTDINLYVVSDTARTFGERENIINNIMTMINENKNTTAKSEIFYLGDMVSRAECEKRRKCIPYNYENNCFQLFIIKGNPILIINHKTIFSFRGSADISRAISSTIVQADLENFSKYRQERANANRGILPGAY
ncbi:hypothetical protein [Photobacterium leiognathi]|uniref:hypothetical protein n=1 Tax=Photobacterium leiognathi TaxID=553611 RepID=UPI002981E6B1|nr:hypothetical protein [Photobacterium leiognathi]